MTERPCAAPCAASGILMRRAVLVCAFGMLGGCAQVVKVVASQVPVLSGADVSGVEDAVPHEEPRSKYGNPASYVVNGHRYYVMNSSRGYVERGIASWYGSDFHGKRTSSGETYDMYGMTAAHKTLPLPTYVEVTNLQNGRRVVVRVNDRGPFHENRIIDLTYTAASKLDIIGAGTGLVEVRALDPRTYKKLDTPTTTVASDVLTRALPAFFIQVGAFASATNAERLRDRITSIAKGLVQISEAKVNGQSLYRVRIGPITDIDLSDRIVDSLESLGLTDHHIVLN